MKLTRIATTALVLGSGFLFAAASCDSQKKDPPKTEPIAKAADAGVDAKAVVYEGKRPKSVGPQAPAVFFLSALKGYTEPCGCTLDVMLGGIDRIAGYVDQARPLYPAVEIADAGDLLFETKTLEPHEIPQEKAKVDVVVQGLADMKVAVTVPGEKDFALGPEYYLAKLQDAGITPIAANLSIEGATLAKTRSTTLDGVDVLYVGVVDPALYEGIEAVKAMAPEAGLKSIGDEIQEADVTILLVHGAAPFAKEVLAATPGADFAVVGHDPRETDQVDTAGGGFTLEPYDQGRYLGILKFFNAKTANGGAFVNSRTGSKAELEKIERQIDHVNNSINGMPPATPGKEPEVLLTLRKRLEDLEARREEIKNAAIDVPSDKPAFLWRSVAMEPGFQPDPQITAIREQYNKQLQALNASVEFEIPEAKPGEAVYIGTNTCETCHTEAKTFWDATAHSRAMKTLEERHKDFDQKCVSCHVDGWEKPGGSVLGKLSYDATIPSGKKEIPVHKELGFVGCESCHGPGSNHWLQPTGPDGAPANIIRDPGPEQCMQCHVPEHSPRFRYDIYVEEITGEGHVRTPKP